ncbi:hypothetical protein CBM2588_A80072 [Cupriavidus taiwanensis]|nr:hypothetical protein CBM2588_A80072 [Cupriavidus taiwanensis]SOY80107.1 hypothetical protein CBM2591_A120070 [Cupriavidus taiwanensis]SPD42946.1 protein of unknown function [Cupriavidus taiwanensis]
MTYKRHQLFVPSVPERGRMFWLPPVTRSTGAFRCAGYLPPQILYPGFDLKQAPHRWIPMPSPPALKR